MILSKTEIEKAIDSKMKLESLDIKLTQKTTGQKNTYSGPGCIFQSSDGTIKLKMYHTYTEDLNIIEELSSQLREKEIIPGKIIGDHHYYDLEAKDLHGRTWTEKGICISETISINAPGRIIECKLRKISTTLKQSNDKENKKSNLIAIVAGDFNLPLNEFERTEQSITRNTCLLDLQENNCKIIKRDGHIEISAQIPNHREEKEYAKILLEALSIGTGKLIKPKIKIITTNSAKQISIYSTNPTTNKGESLQPIPSILPAHADNLSNFTSKCINKIDAQNSPLFGYWHRILNTESGEIENKALVLTTCIEGILKKYYKNLREPDESFKIQIDAAIEEINRLEIGERAKHRAISSLNTAKSISPKIALKSLSQSGLFSGRQIETWLKLRNKSAHADQLRKSNEEIQHMLDEIHVCTELFYILLLQHIEYHGPRIEYSKYGWPASQ